MEEVIQYDCFDREPDEVESEETGNEGVDETHLYHSACEPIFRPITTTGSANG